MKLGFDVTGTAMGLLTIPMALLSAGSAVAGLVLAARGHWPPVLLGLAALLFWLVLARPLEALVVRIDDAANLSQDRGRHRLARAIAVASGAVPVAVILAAEVLCLRAVLASDAGSHPLLVWLWGYGAATAPWTLFAQRVGRFRRTLVGIRAYAGHVAMWLFSILALWLHAPAGAVAAAMLVPAILPFTVGLLLALADRDAIANVRV
ncbi:hypothetical protein [Sphingomonas bacterium]|uniref:hypothetical protein n=1 Tax=Sphingomonas bacterium TaxID=1895847 RepID=UPI001575F1C1|nr:hypothetical protein [Sphingomonas bacterium]